jgi:hypothetical protein
VGAKLDPTPASKLNSEQPIIMHIQLVLKAIGDPWYKAIFDAISNAISDI